MSSKKQPTESFFKRHKVAIIIIILLLLAMASRQEESEFEITKYTSSCIDACSEECHNRDFSHGSGECLSCGYWKTNMEYKDCDCECW